MHDVAVLRRLYADGITDWKMGRWVFRVNHVSRISARAGTYIWYSLEIVFVPDVRPAEGDVVAQCSRGCCCRCRRWLVPVVEVGTHVVGSHAGRLLFLHTQARSIKAVGYMGIK